jgi:MOSC domain-containing protein
MTGQVGTVQALWRFPVKSMAGEQLDAADVTPGGLIGDRAYAIVDRETGKVASAKHPKLWPDLLKCRAALVEEPRPGDGRPACSHRARRRYLGAD